MTAGQRLVDGLAMIHGGFAESAEAMRVAMDQERTTLNTKLETEVAKSTQLAAELTQLRAQLEAQAEAHTSAIKAADERVATLEGKLADIVRSPTSLYALLINPHSALTD